MRRPGPAGLRPALPWGAAGVAAAGGGLAVAELVGAVTGPSSTPLVAAGAAFVDLTPGWLKDAAIAAFGTHDKLALLVGEIVVLLLLAAGAGVLSARRPRPARWTVLAAGAVAALAAATRPDAGGLAVLPSVAGAVVSAVLLDRLRDRALDAGAGRPGRDPDRRDLLRASLLVGAVAAVVGAGARVLGTAARGVDAARGAVKLPAPSGGPAALPAGVEVGVPGVTPFRVPTPDFYRIDTATLVPRVDPAGWRLRVHGMVAREVTLDYATLLTRSLVERDVTLMCVSNEVGGDLVGNARWLGLPIAGVLAEAGPLPGADMVLSTSADGWTCSTPLGVLTDGRDALLAVGMNGEALPVEHGFPVRMVVPGLYGYVSATKWVVDLEVTRFDRATAYWTRRGWSPRGPIKTKSRIDVPRAGARLAAGRVAIAGVAWAQHRGIRGVEVRVDDGPWQPARLGAEASVDTWRQWTLPWDATPGRHRIAVRATDGTGTVQTAVQAPPVPDGATGLHIVDVEVG